jgi:predicted dehydrogenase
VTVRLAQIGVGHVHAAGKTKVARNTAGADFAGIYEPDPRLREAKTGVAPYDGVHWFESVDEILTDPGIGGVLVETSPFESLPWAYRALEAGKHIHLDKAPGTNYAEFVRVIELARRRGLMCQLGYQLRYHPGVEFLFEAVRSGMLGQVQSVRGRKSSPRVQYDSFRAEVGRSPGGMMFYIGCHLLDLVIGLMGRPTSVHSVLRRDNPVPDPIVDSTVVVLEFPAAVATIETTALEVRPVEKRRMEVYGSAGSIILDPMEGPALLLCLQEASGPYKAGWQTVEVGDRPRYVGDIAEFARCIETGEAPRVAYDHDLLTQEVLLRSCGVAV